VLYFSNRYIILYIESKNYMKVYLKKKLIETTNDTPCRGCYFEYKDCEHLDKFECISETLDFIYVEVKYKEKTK